MKRIVVMGLGLALALPCAASAQYVPSGQRGTEMGGVQGDLAAQLKDATSPPATLLPGDTAPSGQGSSQRPPRPDNALGPDLAGAIFAPIGVIVAPFTEGLHAFDAAIAPVNEALQPITGPYDAAPAVGPDGTPAVAEPVPPAPAPAGVGPRK